MQQLNDGFGFTTKPKYSTKCDTISEFSTQSRQSQRQRLNDGFGTLTGRKHSTAFSSKTHHIEDDSASVLSSFTFNSAFVKPIKKLFTKSKETSTVEENLVTSDLDEQFSKPLEATTANGRSQNWETPSTQSGTDKPTYENEQSIASKSTYETNNKNQEIKSSLHSRVKPVRSARLPHPKPTSPGQKFCDLRVKDSESN